MLINADKPHLWKADVERSIDFYNDWFLRFAPETYRKQRAITAKNVKDSLKRVNFLKEVTPDILKVTPEILPILRMTCAPPIARDRLMGLAYATKNLIISMEGSPTKPPRIPPQMNSVELNEQLDRICAILFELADRDLFPWLEFENPPKKKEIERASTVVADRLCGATADPIIRNAQEKRQLNSLKIWLESKDYSYISPKEIDDFAKMPSGTFTFRMNLSVGKESRKINIPIDAIIQPIADRNSLPILIEAKSAGDATNTNKRRKEEAQKFSQLKKQYGEISFVLFLCGYFEPGYLGYEASEGIDWVWEHRISDFDMILNTTESKKKIHEPQACYVGEKEKIEDERYNKQLNIDLSKSQQERNTLGQFSTPFPLACEIISLTRDYLNSNNLSVLEPAVGTGVFFSALNRLDPHSVKTALGIEIDAEYAQVAHDLWPSPYRILEDDFFNVSTTQSLKNQFNFLCANPPYVRHHHILGDLKRNLHQRVENELGLHISGLSGLYIYFILLSHNLLAENAVASWLIPFEFMTVNYGKVLRDYLTRHVTLLQVHQFAPEDVQFDDALVSSCVVTYRKQKSTEPYTFIFSTGGHLNEPREKLKISSVNQALDGKWNAGNFVGKPEESSIKIEDLFEIKRGIATGANAFFILDPDTVRKYSIPSDFLKPLLPGPRYMTTNVVEDDGNGMPSVERVRYLLNCDLPPAQIKKSWPGLWEYLEEGVERGIPDCYICSHRKLWYLQEKRLPPLFLTTYMGRVRKGENRNPFRFILNHSKAIATNVYIYLYPKPFLRTLLEDYPDRVDTLHQILNRLSSENLIRNGRTYGGGLHKLEPKELAGMPLPELPEWLHISKKVQPFLPLTF